ncbi:MAG: pyruvate kinase, partial [Gemmatimonadetes bacterium]|nr:pyruvate kinase [Gemmatimonadota bacterium]NNM07142.1 pyruvate kinase [Gemmatimonadota bacterium]
SGTEIGCVVVVGGTLSDKKGMNLPGVKVSAPALTERDAELARFALELGVDFLALSFVRRADDLQALREIMREYSHEALMIAKIERSEALENIEEILAEADGIMVARGDLGVELPPEKVPLVQGQLVELARDWEKPVIVATQMLESMTQAPRPTRAEVMDVSHAVTELADAVMLSGETAVGRYPLKAVQMMDRVVRETEGFLWEGQRATDWALTSVGKAPPLGLEDAVARATAQLTRDLKVRCIVVFTATGWTAGKVSAARPQAPILAATSAPRAGGRTSLFWGVEPIEVDSLEPGTNHDLTKQLALDSGLAKEGDYVLEVRGFSADPERDIPTLAVCRL